MDFSLEDIRVNRERLGELVVETPVWWWRGPALVGLMGEETNVCLKLELFQYTGSFKPRGALSVMLDLDADALVRGVAAVSAGNHAIAVAFAAQTLGTTAKVVMPKTANPMRVARCRSYGADVVLVENVQEAFAQVKEIEAQEGRHLVHPYEGRLTALGTASIALEWLRQAPALDAVIIPIGGGGLCAGIAAAVKLLNPACQVFGVEPVGADSMYRSFVAGAPQAVERVQTIADSLGAPFALPYSFGLCREFVDDIVLVEDIELRRAMGLLYGEMKLAVEPAGAAATAALCGPLAERLRGRNVGLIVCGANIDLASFAQQTLA